ncbi:hypothetical protein [Geomonas anaerohicana]|uniref:Uncharacterized protein n=1 Tax=Geomonas anaerohicana TaxID=2798583 RepID=A0ABS0YC47_9BACT|nr:hypothetical protein [Geomonas anaerohicana]MBJ6749875.1 hypothetical protein [Geomonas anaerohicana]
MAAGYLSWNCARPIAKEYFQFWPDGEDMLWAKSCWAAVEKSGLAVYHTEQEEMVCLSYVGLLALFYQEFAWRLGVETYKPLSEDNITEIFYASLDEIDSGLVQLREALQDRFGLMELYRMTLLSVEAGRQGARIPSELASEYESCFTYGPESMGLPFERAFSFVNGAILHPEELCSVTIPRAR